MLKSKSHKLKLSKLKLSLIPILFFSLAASFFPDPENIVAPDLPEKGYHIIVLAGQSNAAGYGFGAYTVDRSQDSKIFQIGRDGASNLKIIPATDTLQNWGYYSTADNVGFGMNFAREYIKTHPTKKVLLVPAAKGSTTIQDWQPGGEPYNDMKLRISTALQTSASQLVALLWHQGEGNAGMATADYKPLLQKVFQSMRNDFASQGSFAILMGKLVPGWLSGKPEFANKELIYAAMMEVTKSMTNTRLVSSDGLKSNKEVGALNNGKADDDIHFCADSQVEFGKRYYEVFANPASGWSVTNSPPPSTYVATGTLLASPSVCSVCVCSIPSTAKTCTTTISWNTTNAPNACVYIANQRMACGAQGSHSVDWISEGQYTFELRSGLTSDTTLLHTVIVMGTKGVAAKVPTDHHPLSPIR